MSDREIELINMPSIAVQLPVGFVDGVVLDKLTANCKSCNLELRGEAIRGNIVRLNSNVFAIDGAAVCMNCRTVTATYYRIHSDGRISGYSSFTGSWTEWNRSKRSLFSRFMALLLFRV